MKTPNITMYTHWQMLCRQAELPMNLEPCGPAFYEEARNE
ncbi:hypothetical protein LEMLEM_LOCUS22369 [Lemmus lemmus]